MQDPGFEIRNVTVLSLDLPAGEYTGSRTAILARDLVAQLDHVAGMPACGVTMDVPLGRGVTSTSFHRSGDNEKQSKRVVFHEVSGGYFDVLGIPVTAGRNFEAADGGREVVILNQTMARRYWPGENPGARAWFSAASRPGLWGWPGMRTQRTWARSSPPCTGR
jgi:hypothetical protein